MSIRKYEAFVMLVTGLTGFDRKQDSGKFLKKKQFILQILLQCKRLKNEQIEVKEFKLVRLKPKIILQFLWVLNFAKNQRGISFELCIDKLFSNSTILS